MNLIQFKRGHAARWTELNLVLSNGEPGFEYDTKKFKIGDGQTPWNQLPYIGETNIVFAETFADLPAKGDINYLYKVNSERTLYSWNSLENKYESLNTGSFDPDQIKFINGGNANE